MGASFSSFRRSSSSSKGKPKAVISCSNNTSAGSSIIDQLMKPDQRLKTKKMMMKNKQFSHHSPSDKKIAKVRECFTLEELLMASPSWNFSNYRKVHPSSSSRVRTALSCKARDSFSLEKRVRPEEDSSIISRAESGNSKKKVSFRLPEAADIVIFYSPAGQS